jgi:hypothetical protein
VGNRSSSAPESFKPVGGRVPRSAITALEREWLKVLRELHPDWLWGYRDGDA